MNLTNKIHIGSTVENFMTIFRSTLDNLFVKKNYKINAKIILEQLKQKEIDIEKIEELFNQLPKGEWNIKTFFNNIDKLNEIFTVTNEDIRNYSVENLNNIDIEKVRWELSIESMLEYSKFSTEFYDALKYNNSDNFSKSKIKLLNEFMMTFKFIKKISQEIYENFKNKKLSKSLKTRFNNNRIPLEFLVLRIFYIIINLKEANDKKLEHYANLLNLERVSIMYQKSHKK